MKRERGVACGHSNPYLGLDPERLPDAVAVYLQALRSRDLDSVPFAPSVTFDGPLAPRLIGVRAVLGFLGALLSVIHDVRPGRHFACGGGVALRVDLLAGEVCVPSFQLLDVAGGLIQRVGAFHDPRPILGALAGRGQSLFLEMENEQ